jgi:hypothetical protein
MKQIFRLACLCLGVFCASWSFSLVYATPLTHATPSTVYTIQWFDVSGHVIKTWQGNWAEAEKIQQHERELREKILSRQPRQPAKISPLINRVDGCTLPNGYFVLRNEGLVCFANNGAIMVGIHSVYEIDSGGNSGVFSWGYLCPGSNTDLCQWGNISFKHSTSYFPPLGLLWYIWEVNITGR